MYKNLMEQKSWSPWLAGVSWFVVIAICRLLIFNYQTTFKAFNYLVVETTMVWFLVIIVQGIQLIGPAFDKVGKSEGLSDFARVLGYVWRAMLLLDFVTALIGLLPLAYPGAKEVMQGVVAFIIAFLFTFGEVMLFFVFQVAVLKTKEALIHTFGTRAEKQQAARSKISLGMVVKVNHNGNANYEVSPADRSKYRLPNPGNIGLWIYDQGGKSISLRARTSNRPPSVRKISRPVVANSSQRR